VTDVLVLSTANGNMSDTPVWMQPESGDPSIYFTGTDLRGLLTAAYPQPGMVNMSSFLITPSSGLTVNISAGSAVVPSANGAGSYLVRSIGTVPLTLPSNVSGSTITYRVVAEVLDSFYLGTVSIWQFAAVPSSPGGLAPQIATMMAAGRNVTEIGKIAITTGLGTIIASNIGYDTREMAANGGSWVTVSSFGSGWSQVGGDTTVRYRMDGGGNVRLAGLVRSVGGPNANAIFTLPPPYVPAEGLIVPVSVNFTTEVAARLSISNTGVISVYVSDRPDMAVSSLCWVSLDGVSFNVAR
jgi:hypothetical protein